MAKMSNINKLNIKNDIQKFKNKLKFKTITTKRDKKGKIVRSKAIKLIDYRKLKNDKHFDKSILKFFNDNGKLKSNINIYTNTFTGERLSSKNKFVYIKTSKYPKMYELTSLLKYLNFSNNGLQLDPARSIGSYRNGRFGNNNIIMIPGAMKKQILKILRNKKSKSK